MAPQDEPMETKVLALGDEAIAEAARLVLAGLPVAVPTETVYGLAADATSDCAVARIYAAKGRPSFNPLIVHVADVAQAEAFGARFGECARGLAEAFWPGAVTLVVPLSPFAHLARAASAGLGTVAVRVPSHPAMRALLQATRRPLAAPSANASGQISPTTADHVVRSLGGRIPLVIDGGRTDHGLESTIVKVTGTDVEILRPGPVTAASVAVYAALATRPRPLRIEAPGMLASHYAPSKPLRLDVAAPEPCEWFVGFGPMACDDNLSPAGDLKEAAAGLFAALHRAEAGPKPQIAFAPIPEKGIGLAINDRLRRAAAPKET